MPAGMRPTILVVILSLAGSAAADAIYRWTDASGQVHFGSRPPPGQGELLRPDTASGSSAPKAARGGESPLQRQKKLLESFERDRAYRREKAQERERQARQQRRYCRQLQKQLDFLNHPGPIFFERGGERHYLGDAERARQRRQVEEAMAGHCR